MTTREIEIACAVAYYNQKVRELELAEKEMMWLIADFKPQRPAMIVSVSGTSYSAAQ